MRPELHDNEIERQLARRAAAEWQPERVLTAVRRAMDEARTERVATPRWAALAALVGLLGVLVLLAVALPRLDLAPAAPSPTPAGGVVVLSTEEFATRLVTGELNGATVLVEGWIDPVARDPLLPKEAPPCGPSDDDDCLDTLGMLVDAGDVRVFKRWTAVSEADVTMRGGPRDGWQWWDSPEAPVEGTLLMTVDDAGRVIFEGRARRTSAGLIATAADAARLDSTQLRLDEVLLVDGWLTMVPGAISCRPPDPGTVLEGLPDKWCGNPAWIAPEPVAIDPSGFSVPDDFVSVQHGAYFQFADDPAADEDGLLVPRWGTYALARRLYGGGCPENQPPCWDWMIVERLAGSASAPVVTPSPLVTTAPETPPSIEDALPATWELASTEFLSEATRSFEVVVHENACAGGLSPEGRILPPEIDYGEEVIQIRFMVQPRPGINTCPGAPGAPFRVELTQPIGTRMLVDAGADPPVDRLSVDDDLRVVTLAESFPYEFGDQRMGALLGPDACIETIYHDREEDTVDFESWAADVAGGEGMTANGYAWLGEAPDAARAFGAFELIWRSEQRTGGGAVAIMAVAAGQAWLGAGEDGRLASDIASGSLIVADMYGQQLRSGRVLWIVAHARHSAGGAQCPSEGAVSGDGPAATASVGEFELVLRAGRAEYAVDEPIDVEATLTYHGAPGDSVDPAGTGHVWFRVERVDGDLRMVPVQMMICQRLEPLEAGVPRVTPFFKGGYGFETGDPNADFLRRYWEDPELRLPAGVWQITATSVFGVGDCGRSSVDLEASIIIHVR
jgi:hypothetical protein